MPRLSTRHWRDDDLIVATGKANPFRSGTGAHERVNYVLDAARRGLSRGKYRRECEETGLTLPSTLRRCVREGLIKPLTDEPPAPIAAAADAAIHVAWMGIHEIGKQITRLAEEHLRRLT
jgi:hypothetical protein